MIKKVSIFAFSLFLALTTLNNTFACGCMGGNSGATEQTTEGQIKEGKVQCPVMKTWFTPNEVTEKADYKGKTYFFCCAGCKTQFEQDPEKYVNESGIKS